MVDKLEAVHKEKISIQDLKGTLGRSRGYAAHIGQSLPSEKLVELIGITGKPCEPTSEERSVK